MTIHFLWYTDGVLDFVILFTYVRSKRGSRFASAPG